MKQEDIPSELDYNGIKGATGTEIVNFFGIFLHCIFHFTERLTINNNKIGVPPISI